jgi:NAD(P)-dependent dehydrogenase (short-subunit alcohol dehydrogenase family)
VVATLPGHRWEVAYAALFLMSHDASYINGQYLFVDGGLLSGSVK